jgi:hypothetical protein
MPSEEGVTQLACTRVQMLMLPICITYHDVSNSDLVPQNEKRNFILTLMILLQCC